MLRRMRSMPKVARAEFRKALEKSSDEMSDTAKRFAPVDDGDLKKSIGRTFGNYRPDNANVRGVAVSGRGDPDLTVTVHAGDEKAWYAALVEFGTQPHEQPNNPFNGGRHPGSAPHPYFFPAYRLLRKRARSRLATANRKAVKAAAGK